MFDHHFLIHAWQSVSASIHHIEAPITAWEAVYGEVILLVVLFRVVTIVGTVFENFMAKRVAAVVVYNRDGIG